jgi:hypothetical protein
MFQMFTNLLADRFGSSLAERLYPPFSLGERESVCSSLRRAGFDEIRAEIPVGRARFASMHDFVHINVRGWTLDDAIDDRALADLCVATERELERFVTPDGQMAFDSPAHIVSARAPGTAASAST